MEFDEVQRIWSVQNSRVSYNIDELHRRVFSRKAKAVHIANISEWMLIATNIGAGFVSFWTNVSGGHPRFFIYVLAVWMWIVAALMIVSRVNRIMAGRKFDRSVQGELRHGLAVANYQVRLSRIMRWNVFVIGALIIFSFWESGKAWWLYPCVVVFIFGTWYASKFELRLYVRQRQRLVELKQQLERG